VEKPFPAAGINWFGSKGFKVPAGTTNLAPIFFCVNKQKVFTRCTGAGRSPPKLGMFSARHAS
jgi:hypothetical protein